MFYILIVTKIKVLYAKQLVPNNIWLIILTYLVIIVFSQKLVNILFV